MDIKVRFKTIPHAANVYTLNLTDLIPYIISAYKQNKKQWFFVFYIAI